MADAPMSKRPTCLACLYRPVHEVRKVDGSTVDFCEEHWREVERRLLELSQCRETLLAEGVHPRMAERLMRLRVGR